MTGRGKRATVGDADHGHRLGPHTADCMIEAWGPDRPTCLVEAMTALVQLFADPVGATPTRSVPLSLPAGRDPDLLVSALEEVIYLTDLGTVPVGIRLADDGSGGVTGHLDVVDARQVVLVGPIPKAVSYHRLEMVEERDGWHCRAIVDV